eukprot:11329499-Alexandrium_andersonii.AAC.1
MPRVGLHRDSGAGPRDHTVHTPSLLEIPGLRLTTQPADGFEEDGLAQVAGDPIESLRPATKRDVVC